MDRTRELACVMSIGTILLIALVLLLLGAVPARPYSGSSGCNPSGFVGALRLVVIVLMPAGVIARAEARSRRSRSPHTTVTAVTDSWTEPA